MKNLQVSVMPPMHLAIDFREQRSGVVHLAAKTPNLQVEVRQMKQGDYCVNHQAIFERKTIPDFIAAIKSGRFFRQSYLTIKRTTPYILILEGSNSDLKNSEIKHEAIQGALVHISLFLGIPILRSRNIEETLKLMVIAGNQIYRHDGNLEPRIYNNHQKTNRKNHQKVKYQVLQSLPGVGHKRATSLLNHYKTLNNIFSSDINDLQGIDGIGKRTAAELVRIIYEQ